MKKLRNIILFIICLIAGCGEIVMAQAPINPVRQITNTTWLEPSTNNMWGSVGNGATLQWRQWVDSVQMKRNIASLQAHIDSSITNNSTQTYAFTAPTSGTNTVTNSGLIGMYVFGVYRSGLRYDIISTGSPVGNQVLLNGSTGAVTFQDNFNTANAEKGYVEYKSISGGTPTAPAGLQILYAANYATASTYFTGSGNKLVYVKNDEVNGGTNADGSFASSIYQYSSGYKLFYIRTGAN